jgi:predicted 3-demethylubiquinone-9 3-methyltransferase (glyoxalase superfamily)
MRSGVVTVLTQKAVPVSWAFHAAAMSSPAPDGLDLHHPPREFDPADREEHAVQQKIVPNLWFDTEAEEAAHFYTAVFKNGRIVNVAHYTEAGPREAGMVMTVEFELDGQRFVGINGSPEFKFDEAVSFQINCEDQDEVDYYWEKLSDGGEEGPCGWLKDRFGLSWQVVPAGMEELFSDPDPEKARRAMEAMLKMKKLDIAGLRSAAEGAPVG